VGGLNGAQQLLPAQVMAAAVDDFIKSADARPWNPLKNFDWSQVRPERLSPAHRSALSFVTYIEDHVPGYLAAFLRRHPVDASVSSEEFIHNRELFRFYARWIQEEEAHAHVLFRYQVASGMAEPQRLREELATVGTALFEIPGADVVHAFTYTVIQEKATQQFYQQFARVVEDDVLRSVLQHMARDEARHFAFFARVLEEYLRHFGDAVMPAIKETLTTFKMPLARVLTRYWRWSIEIADGVGGYNHVDAYPALLKIIKRVQGTTLSNRAAAIEEFVKTVCRIDEV
jgi:hypothetical protein